MSNHPLSRLLQYAQSDKNRIIKASVLSVLNKIADLAPPALIGVAVDIVIKDSILAQWGIVDGFYQLVVLAVITIVVWGLESILSMLFNGSGEPWLRICNIGCVLTLIDTYSSWTWGGFATIKVVV